MLVDDERLSVCVFSVVNNLGDPGCARRAGLGRARLRLYTYSVRGDLKIAQQQKTGGSALPYESMRSVNDRFAPFTAVSQSAAVTGVTPAVVVLLVVPMEHLRLPRLVQELAQFMQNSFRIFYQLVIVQGVTPIWVRAIECERMDSDRSNVLR